MNDTYAQRAPRTARIASAIVAMRISRPTLALALLPSSLRSSPWKPPGDLRAHGDGRIHARGAQGGNPAGGDADGGHDERHGHERDRIARSDAEQQSLHQPGCEPGAD